MRGRFKVDKKERIKELVDILNKASKAYYQDAKEIMSNFEYDALYDVAQCGVSCFKEDKPNVLEVNDFEIQRLGIWRFVDSS